MPLKDAHDLDRRARGAGVALLHAPCPPVAACRRLWALAWLVLLAFDDPSHPRNPPGTAARQADRLLELLS